MKTGRRQTLGRRHLKQQRHDQQQNGHHLVARRSIQYEQPEGTIINLQGFVELVPVCHNAAESIESEGMLTLRCLRRSVVASFRRSWNRSMMLRRAPGFTAGTSGLPDPINDWNGLIGTPCLCQDLTRWCNTSLISVSVSFAPFHINLGNGTMPMCSNSSIVRIWRDRALPVTVTVEATDQSGNAVRAARY